MARDFDAFHLKREIRASKRACFDGLCQNANRSPWGDAYRVVMAKTKEVMAPTEPSDAGEDR